MSDAAPRLCWAGREGYGGILCVAETTGDAVSRAHAELCDCGESGACMKDPVGWSATDIERHMQEEGHTEYSLRLIRRDDGQPPTPVGADGPRLWWMFDDARGLFVVVEQADAFENINIAPMEIEQIRRVDGYDVVVVREDAR